MRALSEVFVSSILAFLASGSTRTLHMFFFLQVAAGRTFKDRPSFVAKPDHVVFKDFVVGKVSRTKGGTSGTRWSTWFCNR